MESGLRPAAVQLENPGSERFGLRLLSLPQGGPGQGGHRRHIGYRQTVNAELIQEEEG